ncbi:glycosyltransferase [Algoriphagus sp.]|uniref:glycosyltransferase n=1 Tax=Algoriphagus sp. TaxID=1872435 RepID=UPI003F6F2E77
MGGAERMTVNIANLLADEGVNSHVIISRFTGALEKNLNAEVKVKHLGKTSFKDVKAFKKLYDYIGMHKPDIIHCHATSLYWGFALKLLFPKLKLIWHDHFGLSDQLDKYPRRSYKMMSKGVSGIIVVNQKLEIFWKSYLSSKDYRVAFMPNFPLLAPSQESKNPVFTFVCLANFRPQKNQLNLVKAVELLAKQEKNFRVILAGQLIDKTWYLDIKRKIEELKLGDYIHILGPVEDVSTLLHQVHVGVLSSDSEGLPVSLLEYALTGLPIITTDVGDCKKVLDNGRLGWVVKPNDPLALSEAMLETMKNYLDASEKAEAAKDFVQQNYGTVKFYNAYTTFITSLD